MSKGALAWALEALVVGHLTVARIADALGMAWNTANDAVLAEGKRVLISDPARFEGVGVIGVDEHVWRHTRRGDKYVTVIIDLTPVRDRTGPARLLDMVEGRSTVTFQTWLSERPKAWRDAIEVVAMDGFTGFKTAATAELPQAVTVTTACWPAVPCQRCSAVTACWLRCSTIAWRRPICWSSPLRLASTRPASRPSASAAVEVASGR